MWKKVFLVDDDKLPMEYYVRALEQKGFEVKQCFEPDSALEFAAKECSEICAIVLDIMMPPGKKYEGVDTHQGLMTGLFLLHDLRRHCPDTPVVVLTNVRNPKTLGKLKGEPLLEVVQKMDYPPFEFAELVDKITKKYKERYETEGN
jgi:CheY-like chemotaxis protein